MTVTPSPYCSGSDLIIGAGVILPDTLDRDAEVKRVADEMDALLGFIYRIPLENLKPNEALLLKTINIKMASGSILLQLYGDGEGTALHAYGLRLVTEAREALMQLANGAVYLSADRADSGTPLDQSRGPKVTNYDAMSGVEVYESAIMRGEGITWVPGGGI